MIKVSIIVPVYNVEKFLHECLDSIKQQSFINWECLLIDDGSTDDSGKICDEYAQVDSRFKVFHVLNGGVSRARNIGLKNMTGEWAMFVDSDDAIASNTIEVCVNQVEKQSLDLLQFFYTRNKDKLCEKIGERTEVLNLDEFAKTGTLVTVWGNLFRSSIIRKCNLFFEESVKLAEDQLFFFSFASVARRFQKIGDCLYWYRDNVNSAVNNSKSVDMIYSVKTLAKFKKKNQIWEAYVDQVNVTFLLKIICNNDLNLCLMKKLIRDANLSNLQMISRGLPILFCLACKISYSLAIFLVKFRRLFLKDTYA